MRLPSNVSADTVPPGPDLSRYILVCLVLLGAVLLVAWLFRRFLAGELRRRASLRSLQVLDVLPLGGRQKLMVVRCYDRNFLLGLGDKEVRSIAELDPEVTLVPEPPPEGVAKVDTRTTPAEFVEFATALERELPEPATDHERAPQRRESVLRGGLLG